MKNLVKNYGSIKSKGVFSFSSKTKQKCQFTMIINLFCVLWSMVCQWGSIKMSYNQ